MSLIDNAADWLAHRFIPDHDAVQEPATRRAYGYLEGWISIVGNLLIFALKLVLGLAANSVSLIADSFHTLSDVLTSLVVIVGFRISKKPADETHPFGHGRFESVASLVIAILLILVGLEFLQTSVGRILDPVSVEGSLAIAAVILATGLAKEVMARIAMSFSRKIDSSAVKGDAWHHRTDAIASALVAFAIAMAAYGYPAVDAYLGLGVSLLVILTGVGIARDAVDYLLGRSVQPDVRNELSRLAATSPGVVGVHKLKVHDYGGTKFASIHVWVDSSMSVRDSHTIAHGVRDRICTEYPAITLDVHVEPSSTAPEKGRAGGT